MRGNEELSAAAAALERASRDQLAELWVEYFGIAPPSRMSRALLMRAIAYKMQERVLGGLSPALRQFLAGGDASPRRKVRAVSPGVVLIREWQGDTHQVTVAEHGVLYRGKQYRSLSEVARRITGARWSGPRFFGLAA